MFQCSSTLTFCNLTHHPPTPAWRSRRHAPVCGDSDSLLQHTRPSHRKSPNILFFLCVSLFTCSRVKPRSDKGAVPFNCSNVVVNPSVSQPVYNTQTLQYVTINRSVPLFDFFEVRRQSQSTSQTFTDQRGSSPSGLLKRLEKRFYLGLAVERLMLF